MADIDSPRRVVVTGLGMVSSLGNSVEASWQAILAQKSGVTLITDFDTTDFAVKFAAGVKNFDPTRYLSEKDSRHYDDFILYAVAATQEAMHDANLVNYINQLTDEHKSRMGVAIGSGIGGLHKIEHAHTVLTESGPRKLSPFFLPGTIINLAAGYVAIQYQFQGPNFSVVSACSTSAHNVGIAARLIRYGEADVMIAGGSEHAISPLGVGGFAAMRALSRRNDAPEQASRPWDRDRDGFVLGSGAGILILESYEFAKKRGAKIYAELVGFGMTDDAFHPTLPDPQGIGSGRCMALALQDGRINSEQVDYINAHATSTPPGDRAEIVAIKKIFGPHADHLAVSSTKSAIGHTLGAAGAIEAIFSILAIRDQVAPPTINLDTPDSDCDLNLVPNHPQARNINISLSNSFGFGGTNTALLFKNLK